MSLFQAVLDTVQWELDEKFNDDTEMVEETNDGSTAPSSHRLAALKKTKVAIASESSPPKNSQEQIELEAFLTSVGETKARKQHQLSIIKYYFEDPIKFDTELANIRAAATHAEVHQALLHRADLLMAVLEAGRAELTAMDDAGITFDTEDKTSEPPTGPQPGT